jgi:AraC family transcriptional regulator, transcriptional activator of pobA
MRYSGASKEQLHIDTISGNNRSALSSHASDVMTVFWGINDDTKLIVDGVEITLQRSQIVFLTEFHKVTVQDVGLLRLIRFNRPFYCIVDHDQEVSCKGILFFGASQVPVITVPVKEHEKFETLWAMFTIEMQSKDNLQKEMLQMMLKRFIILCTRLYKEQNRLMNFEKVQLAIIREFNYLVEIHFREKHSVTEYALLLNKSPKTLSNLFSQLSNKSPLQIIQDRILLESKRLLFYTDKTIKEIAYETGFEDIQTFSRFFKTKEDVSPKEFRMKVKAITTPGKIIAFLDDAA